jgi:hypothetical protein
MDLHDPLEFCILWIQPLGKRDPWLRPKLSVFHKVKYQLKTKAGRKWVVGHKHVLGRPRNPGAPGYLGQNRGNAANICLAQSSTNEVSTDY